MDHIDSQQPSPVNTSGSAPCSLQARIAAMRGSAVQIEGWDSYGALAVSDATIDASVRVAQRIDGEAVLGKSIRAVAPTSRGGIVLSDNDESVWIEVCAT